MTDRRYLWRASKRGNRVHIENPDTGQAHCQAENASGGKPFDGRGAEVPAGRRVCGNCADLVGRDSADYSEPNIKVLLGERIAEVEPGLFAGGAAPRAVPRTDLTSSDGRKKWERKNQARPVNRSKGRKPKRSNVKYPRPFDDDLPW